MLEHWQPPFIKKRNGNPGSKEKHLANIVTFGIVQTGNDMDIERKVMIFF
jgi:hypothetical protein